MNDSIEVAGEKKNEGWHDFHRLYKNITYSAFFTVKPLAAQVKKGPWVGLGRMFIQKELPLNTEDYTLTAHSVTMLGVKL